MANKTNEELFNEANKQLLVPGFNANDIVAIVNEAIKVGKINVPGGATEDEEFVLNFEIDQEEGVVTINGKEFEGDFFDENGIWLVDAQDIGGIGVGSFLPYPYPKKIKFVLPSVVEGRLPNEIHLTLARTEEVNGQEKECYYSAFDGNYGYFLNRTYNDEPLIWIKFASLPFLGGN